ncbi:SDR family NAD(P)-dependent oxidoreductase [Maribellus comscasis]|uniref:SDR family NAD(P)-dependent oxidoreductase n=1 Tax=Maribellus comscasis TaxID=2681766 RepID=A0A6I6K3R4_9BACT|nr:SDR family NAD(P)-dependent oxidoreductase [Maribellus comscasis]QGY47062.1 SDR family NAD(P)-dependent oxidoreductase [Maribellus comscasis]
MDTLSLFNLKRKTALITGSGSGIGFALAKGLAGAGAKIILNGRNKTKLEEAKFKLKEEGTTAFPLAFDVSNLTETKNAIESYENREGPIDILINNAGINIRGPFEKFDERDWKKVLDININGAMIASQAVAPFMIKRKAGKIINICSMQSELGRHSIVPYAVSKGGIKMLTKGLCAEWAKYNIQVNGIGPGYFETELTRPLKEDSEFDSWLKNRTPSNRWGDVKELIGAAVFLASDASNYVNGHILYVDGGLLASV